MRKSVLLLALALTLPGCGLKGPLYLPQQKPAAAAPAVVPVDSQNDVKKSPEPK